MTERTREFDPRPFHFHVTTFGKLITFTCLCHQAINLVPDKRRRCPAAGKVTVGLASHWPWVSDFSRLSAYKSSCLHSSWGTHTLPFTVGAVTYWELQAYVSTCSLLVCLTKFSGSHLLTRLLLQLTLRCDSVSLV